MLIGGMSASQVGVCAPHLFLRSWNLALWVLVVERVSEDWNIIIVS